MTIMLACIPPGLSCHPQTLNRLHQDSSVQNEEAVGLEPYILYDPTFRTVVGLNPLLFFIQKRIDGFLNSSLNLFTLNGILDLFTQSSRHIKHVDHLI